MDKQRNLFVVLLIVSLGALAAPYLMPKKQPAANEHASTSAPTKAPTKVAPPAPRIDAAARLRAQQLGTIETNEFTAKVSSLNTGLVHFALKDERYTSNNDPIDLVTTTQESAFPLKIEVGGVPIPQDAVWQLEQVSPTSVRFTWEGGGFRVVRKLEAGQGKYQLWSTVVVTNLSQAARPVRVNVDNYHYVLREDEGSTGFFSSIRRSPLISQALCHTEGKVIRKLRDALGSAQRYAHARYAGIENSYFATVVAAEGDEAEACVIDSQPRWAAGAEGEPRGQLFHSRLIYPRVTVAPNETHITRSLAYFGPKSPATLEHAGHSLSSVVDLGFFAFVGRYLVKFLRIIHDQPFVQNWGLAIILMTILVRIGLFPLTQPQIRSMARMRQLKPEMDRINELYGEDREKKGAATMELYRKHGINPVAGCLPTLMQLPVWFAFYTSLSTNVELFRAPFFGWLQDLSAPDPFFILPVIYAGTMVIQQKITPNTMDPVQAKMMLWMMPGMMLVFTLFLPQGLVIYMLTNAALGLAQQQYIERSLSKAVPSAPPTKP